MLASEVSSARRSVAPRPTYVTPWHGLDGAPNAESAIVQCTLKKQLPVSPRWATSQEASEALAWLTRIGCDYAQGYHISRPVALDALGQWAESRVAAHGSAGRDALSTAVKHDVAGAALALGGLP